MLPINNPPFWLQKKTHRKTGYPLATVACYGPDDQFASKTVIGLVASPMVKTSMLFPIFSASMGR